MRSLFTTLFYLAFLFGICPYSFSDGNQTQIATKIGVWQVVYNGENRPVRWQCGDKMESEGCTYVYALDGNKNISEVVDGNGDVAAHYEYAAFGDAVMVSGEKALANPFRFSSEYADDALGLTYYNYRHLDHAAGRWLSRDPIEEQGGWNLYGSSKNSLINYFDFLGLKHNSCHSEKKECNEKNEGEQHKIAEAVFAPLGHKPDSIEKSLNKINSILLFGSVPGAPRNLCKHPNISACILHTHIL